MGLNEAETCARPFAPATRPLLTPYTTGGEATRRYHQDAAIRAVLEKLARGEKRALLSLATRVGSRLQPAWLSVAGGLQPPALPAAPDCSGVMSSHVRTKPLPLC
jgi:hypothetical protein